ncbi:hypothetical protein [Zavarzinia compransoris]|uniref:Uncharacterized protein n=1 Tax=Zavarzinia compransoris TaxID=1264899 RepID=A0A317E853_9PROT|nr:hypothetical protein [Zavarzinia compransoris]PWR23257.1 hypothetical protein DKG75_01415 [Zavarzinia compransoris]TDP46179.1 hypothetical protein DES42_104265 [Zavarzinia compransoris]
MTDIHLSAAAVAVPGPDRGRKNHLFGPVADFLCLGGGGFALMAAMALLLPGRDAVPAVAVTMMVIANFINHPHFAHSYQIFYRGFGERLRGPGLSGRMRLRYAFAGIVVPAVLFAFLGGAILFKSVAFLGYALNFMGFVVGWHYVKQGFGIAMVDGAKSKRFYAPATRLAMLANGYACWIYTWVQSNRDMVSRRLWDIEYGDIPFDDGVLYAVAGIFAATSLWMVARLALDYWRDGRRFALNGLIGYLVALYAWMAFVQIDPLFVFIAPVLHSLQYLTVVWRFEANRASATVPAGPQESRFSRLAAFGIVGLLLGAMGFWLFPLLLDMVVPYDRAVFGSSLFLFVFWVFINIHHYFIDNVIWRRDNPEAKAHLFS